MLGVALSVLILNLVPSDTQASAAPFEWAFGVMGLVVVMASFGFCACIKVPGQKFQDL